VTLQRFKPRSELSAAEHFEFTRSGRKPESLEYQEEGRKAFEFFDLDPAELSELEGDTARGDVRR